MLNVGYGIFKFLIHIDHCICRKRRLLLKCNHFTGGENERKKTGQTEILKNYYVNYQHTVVTKNMDFILNTLHVSFQRTSEGYGGP